MVEKISGPLTLVGVLPKFLYFSGACGIELEDTVILTGGVIDSKERTTVSIYDKDGWVRDLPNLKTVRKNHGCGHYIDDSNKLVSYC